MSAHDKSENAPTPGTVNQRRPVERRKRNIPVVQDRRGSGGTRPQLPERRRQVDPTTCERDYNDDEIMFMKAMDQYKRDNRRPFPTWSEVLEVLHALGYRRVAEPTALPGNTPSGDDRRQRDLPVAVDRRKSGDVPQKG
jgi:hypothetical protein